jgi:hypothetical protein
VVPVTIHVPAGIAHVFVNPADAPGDLIIAAYAANRYDPGDTVPHAIRP